MGYLQTGPFLDHLAVITNEEAHKYSTKRCTNAKVTLSAGVCIGALVGDFPKTPTKRHLLVIFHL